MLLAQSVNVFAAANRFKHGLGTYVPVADKENRQQSFQSFDTRARNVKRLQIHVADQDDFRCW